MGKIKNTETKNLKLKAKKIIKILDRLFPKSKIALNFSNPWELVVDVILSARNKDEAVNKVTEKLFKKYKTLDDYIKAGVENFSKDINTLGLYKQKAKYIINAAKIIKEKYNGKIPKSIDELTKLPGIGRKSANIIIWNIYKESPGIAVDTHVSRLSRLLGLTKNTNPDKIEKDLMNIIPKERWGDLPYKLIDYGRKYCKANCKHSSCPLKNFIVKK
jgi:endonuclease III